MNWMVGNPGLCCNKTKGRRNSYTTIWNSDRDFVLYGFEVSADYKAKRIELLISRKIKAKYWLSTAQCGHTDVRLDSGILIPKKRKVLVRVVGGDSYCIFHVHTPERNER